MKNKNLFFTKTKYSKKSFLEKGVAAISFVLLVGSITVGIAMAGLLSSYLVSQEGFGLRMSYNASFISQSGIDDAILKITRSGSSVASQTYSIQFGSWTDTVQISKTILINNDAQYTITSSVNVLTKRSAKQAIVLVNNNSGVVQIKSIVNIGT